MFSTKGSLVLFLIFDCYLFNLVTRVSFAILGWPLNGYCKSLP